MPKTNVLYIKYGLYICTKCIKDSFNNKINNDIVSIM